VRPLDPVLARELLAPCAVAAAERDDLDSFGLLRAGQEQAVDPRGGHDSPLHSHG
jgi:hypothetical protein